MSPNQRVDVAIVGGGPAGCSAALSLARTGLRVVLLEARSYPHPKVCGEFMSPECASLLDRLGVGSVIRALGPAPILRAHLTAGELDWGTTLPGVGWGLSRSVLDTTLAHEVVRHGARVYTRTAVTTITGDLRRGFVLQARPAEGKPYEIHARAVLGAHGKHQLLDHQLRRRFVDETLGFVALKAHFEGPARPATVELHTFPGGYVGLVEVETGAVNVCLLMRADQFRRWSERNVGTRTGDPRDKVIAAVRAHSPAFDEWMRQARRIDPLWQAISRIPFVDKDQMAGDVLMIGDAAGLIAPLAGDGMGMALRSGTLGAECVADYLDGRCTIFDLRHEYPNRWRYEFGSRLRLGRWLQRLMLRPMAMAGALLLVRECPALGNYVITHTRQSPVAGYGL